MRNVSWKGVLNMSIGIYIIKNKKTSKFYIGQSINIEQRFASHKTRAFDTNSKEYNAPLYEDMRRYGTFNFSLEILEECSKEDLHIREEFWIQKLEAQKLGYNKTKGGIGVKDANDGENHPNHILTEKDVKEIRRRYANRERKESVFNDYKGKISKSAFHKIWNGVNWSHILPEVYTKENRDFHKHNTANKNDSNGRTQLTNLDVINIRTKRKLGFNIKDVYKDYASKMTYGSFTNVWYYQNWKDIVV